MWPCIICNNFSPNEEMRCQTVLCFGQNTDALRHASFERVLAYTVDRLSQGKGTVQGHEASQFGIPPKEGADAQEHHKDDVPTNMSDITPLGSDGKTLQIHGPKKPFDFERRPALDKIQVAVKSQGQIAQEKANRRGDGKIRIRGNYGDAGQFNAEVISDWKSAKAKGYASLEDR